MTRSDQPPRVPTRRGATPVVALTAAIALAALLLVWLWSAGWRGGGTSPPPGDDAAIGARHAASRPAVDDATASNGDPPAVERAPTSFATAETVQPITLLVVDEQRRPVPGAEVRCDDTGRIGRTVGPTLTDVEAELHDAPVHVTDAHGRTALLLAAASAFVTARAGERYGHDWLDPGDTLTDPIELVIAPDRTLTVCALGPDGERWPTVPIEIGYAWEAPGATDEHTTEIVGRTGADGTLTIHHAQLFHFWQRRQLQVAARAIVLGATTEAVSVELDRAHVHVEVTCPPHGSIHGIACAPDGRPIAAPRELSLAVLAGGAPAAIRELPPWPAPPPGTFVLHPLALGHRWSIATSDHEPVEIQGPAFAGEVVDVRLDRLRTVARLRLIVFRPDGTRCANSELGVWTPDRGPETLATDGNGLLDLPRARTATRIEVSLREPRATAIVLVPAPASDDRDASMELAVHLTAARLLAAGRTVERDTGRPLRTRIQALPVDGPPADGADHIIARCLSDGDGAFELWGAAPTTVRLHATASEHEPAETEVATGATGVRLALASHRRLFVTLQLDPDFDDDEVWLRIVPTEGSSWSKWRTSDSVRQQVLMVPPHDDLTLEALPGIDLAPIVRIPQSAWQRGQIGFTMTVDLRGALAHADVDFACDGRPVEAALYLPGSGSNRVNWGEASHQRVPLATNAATDAIAVPEAAGVARTLLHPGANRVDLPGPTLLSCTCTGLPDDVDAAAVALELYRLRRAEPLLDELARADCEWFLAQDLAMPTAETELAAIDDGEPAFVAELSAPPRFAVVRRGRYAVLPVVVRGDRRHYLFAAAVAVEVANLGDTRHVDVVLRPDDVRRAWRELGGS